MLMWMLVLMVICASLAPVSGFAQDEEAEMLKEAYVYTLPLMMVKATEIKATNTVKATRVQAPVNQMIHAEKLADASSRDVVTPNVDTVYTQVFMDLSKDALVLEFPQTDRFALMQVMDAYTNTVQVIDCMQHEDRAKYIFTGPGWAGEIPEGMAQVQMPTNMGWMIGRVICYGPDDLQNVYDVQRQMDACMLSAYMSGSAAQKPEGEFHPEENFNPRDYVLHLGIKEYFDMANALMLANPPSAADAPLMERLAAIGVGPGLEFDSSIFGNAEEVKALWINTVQAVVGQTLEVVSRHRVNDGCWNMYSDPIADWGTEYDYRAAISLVGLGANPTYVAVYPTAQRDKDGNKLNGGHDYVIHFDAGMVPPVQENGFWSITAYDAENYLIDNELNRYNVNDRSSLIFNEDGSLDIYLQKDAPEGEKKISNWLPVCDGVFQLTMRIYLPEERVMNGEWRMPEIRVVS